MTYEQKLTKIGNSIGIIFPKDLLASLNLDLGDKMYIQKIQNKIMLGKKQNTSISPEFLRVAEEIANKYSADFKELANK